MPLLIALGLLLVTATADAATLVHLTRDNVSGAAVRFTFDTVAGTLTQVDVLTKDRAVAVTIQGASKARTFVQQPNLARSYDVTLDVVSVTETDSVRADGSTKQRFDFGFQVGF